jgi:hypothetical protein
MNTNENSGSGSVPAGTTRPAGEGLSDEEAVAKVASQTDSARESEDVFEREADGAVSDGPAEDLSADDLSE